MSGTLFIVATPIGNLEDLTPRACKTFAEVDVIAVEDTRHTGRLLSHIGVKTRLLALHDHNEETMVSRLIALLESGQTVALASDAGTPLLSDPGYRLVRAAHENNILITPVPGASAVTAALSVAGLPTDRFCFEGFLPTKKTARLGRLKALGRETRTMVFFASVHRIAEVLADMGDAFGAERRAFVGRELTKLHEQCVQGTLAALGEMVADKTIVTKGEFVIVIAGSDVVPETSLEVDRLLAALSEHLSAKDAAKVAAEATGLARNDVYKRLLAMRP